MVGTNLFKPLSMPYFMIVSIDLCRTYASNTILIFTNFFETSGIALLESLSGCKSNGILSDDNPLMTYLVP